MIKPELLVTAGSVAEMKTLIRAGADAVLIGEHAFALRLSGEIKIPHVHETVQYAHAHRVKVYVAVNHIFDEHRVSELPAYLHALQLADVDAIEFTDPAVIIANRGLTQPLKLHWNGEMTATNYASSSFWVDAGACRVVLARELNMEEIRQCRKQLASDVQVQVQVHGITHIYHAKRRLLQSYLQHLTQRDAPTQALTAHEIAELTQQHEWRIIERERKDQVYPIFEDESGTHIMSSEDLCMVENLPEMLELGVNSLKIEGLMKSVAYQETVVRSYRAAIDHYVTNPAAYVWNPQWLTQIEQLQDAKRELSYGFYYKEQVY